MRKLTPKMIERRMVEWRNLKKLHEADRGQIRLLNETVRLLKEESQLKDRIIAEQSEAMQDFQLQLEELQRIVFGRKNKKGKEGEDDEDDDFRPGKEKREPKERSKDSYKRPVPDEKDVTVHEYHSLNPSCPDCGTNLQDKDTIVFHEEDIPLPDKETKLKQITEHHVEKGYCPQCRKWHTATPLPFAKVIPGKRVRLYIVYLSILLRLSFSQIQSLLRDTYHFRISDGEIANILHQTADKLKPEFERIKKRMRKERGIHLDETSWGAFYLWVMASADTEEVLYLAGRTRGKGNADELLGDNFKGVRITDAYSAYKNQPGLHQQCWSHPHTKLRQLAYSKVLNKGVRKHCHKAYGEFSEIYEKLRGYIKEPFDVGKRKKQKQELFEQIRKWREVNPKDPTKLQNVKRQFRDYEDEWLTCIDYDGIPCDNNKAERKLRHFVIKRKISFGNKSQKGHETFEVLASVLMTCWKTCKDNFLPELSALCA